MNLQFEEKRIKELVGDWLGVRSADTEEQKELPMNALQRFGAMLAGGTINSIFSGRRINDLDFYVKDKEMIAPFVEWIESRKFKKVHETENAVTFVKPSKYRNIEVQIIKRFAGTPIEILETFDFTIVQGLYDFEQMKFEFTDNFFKHIAQRKLVFTNTSRYPIAALYRTKKYQERGYTMSGATVVQLSLAIHALKIETYADLKDQLMGIDTAMLEEITKGIDGTKKFECKEFIAQWMEAFYGEDLAFESKSYNNKTNY